MAKTKSELRKELEDISEKTRKAFDALNGTGGTNRRGLYTLLEIAQKDAANEDAFDRVRAQARKDIKTLTKQIKEAEVVYKQFQEKKNSLNRELKKLDKAETEEKTKTATAKGANNVYEKALQELNKAELGIAGYKGEQKYIDAYRKAEEAYRIAVDSGVTVSKALPPARVEIPTVETPGGQQGGKEGAPKEQTITEFISVITDPKNKQLLIDVQKDLAKNFGYKGPVDGSPSKDFLPALQNVFVQRQGLPDAWRGSDLRSFISNPNVAGFGPGSGTGTGTPRVDAYVTISSESQAASAINQIFQAELGRDATKAEIKRLYPQLIKAQAANPNRQKVVNGVRQTVAGLDTGQWIREKAQSLPEFKQRENSANDVNLQSLSKTARANGLDLASNFDEDVIKSWTNRIKNGESIEVFKDKIRQQAFRALPEAVRSALDPELDLNSNLATYVNSYARTFGLPAAQVDIMKVIPLATDEKGFLNVSAFEKKKRSLDEWQYTPEAKEEVSNIASRVLKDFGFQG